VALPATVDLEAYRGDSWSQTFHFMAAGKPLDLTGAIVACWARNSDRHVEHLEVTVDALNGAVTLAMPYGGILPGGYAYDVEVTMPGGKVTTWVRGRLSVERDVTNVAGLPARGPLPATVDLTIYHGDTWAQTFRLLDSSGNPHDLTGATVAATVSNGVAFQVTVGPDPGVITLRLPPAALPVGSYTYDVEVTQAGTVTTWIKGALDVLQDVTP
jgi:hypothetical protein